MLGTCPLPNISWAVDEISVGRKGSTLKLRCQSPRELQPTGPVQVRMAVGSLWRGGGPRALLGPQRARSWVTPDFSGMSLRGP